MALNEFEIERIESAVEGFMRMRRPPEHIRPKFDLGYRISGQSLELFEIRPRWDHPEKKIELPFSKGTFVRRRNVWKVFWMRQDLKWHRYAPAPEVPTVERLLAVVAADEFGCFFG